MALKIKSPVHIKINIFQHIKKYRLLFKYASVRLHGSGQASVPAQSAGEGEKKTPGVESNPGHVANDTLFPI